MKDTDYIKYPTTGKILIGEIIRICDDYLARKLSEEEIRYFIHHWAFNVPELLFNGSEEFNPTLKQRIGSKRLKLVLKMLEGFQHSIK